MTIISEFRKRRTLLRIRSLTIIIIATWTIENIRGVKNFNSVGARRNVRMFTSIHDSASHLHGPEPNLKFYNPCPITIDVAHTCAPPLKSQDTPLRTAATIAGSEVRVSRGNSSRAKASIADVRYPKWKRTAVAQSDTTNAFRDFDSVESRPLMLLNLCRWYDGRR